VSGLADDGHEHDDVEHDHDHEHDEPDGDEQAMSAALEEMMESIRKAKVGELILSTVSTLASVCYGKLEAGELPDAKLAIDAVDVLLPLLDGQVDGAILGEFRRALTDLKLAYADAVSSAK
jgi:hypothetical protein